MNTHFEALKEEKQRRIRNAAMREFGRYGYQKTSAEQIAKAAQISKGMLFHYFGSKLGLFEYLVQYTEALSRQRTEPVGARVRGLDYLEKYRDITRNKLRLALDEPEMTEFMTMLYTQPVHAELSPVVGGWYQTMEQLYGEVIQQLAEADDTVFRTDLGAEKSKRYIEFLMAGFSDHVVAHLQTEDPGELGKSPLWALFDAMLDDLRLLFYKEEKENDHA